MNTLRHHLHRADMDRHHLRRLLGMFNLNDPHWGQDTEKNKETPIKNADPEDHSNNDDASNRSSPKGKNVRQPPRDLDDMFQKFNQKINDFFSDQKKNNNGDNRSHFTPGPKGRKIGVVLIVAAVSLIWLGTGFFIVQEGQQAVITQFGKYHSSVGAGFNWRLPYPIQRHETVSVTQIRSVDVGSDTILPATGLRDSAMLTVDQNIVEIKFAVQYRLNDARAFLFESNDAQASVVKAAETAVREVIGKMKMDAALAEERDQIAPRVRVLMQTILDRYKVGIEVVAINLQQGGVRPPEQVQAAFDDVLKAGQERERAKNEAQAYANDVVPRARGAASRLTEEAEGYRARIVAQAEGDAQRFSSVLTEYQKAPQVTRMRMYTDAMRDIYANVTKILIDSKSNSNLLYLPLDKIMQASTSGSNIPVNPTPAVPATTSPNSSLPANNNTTRLRERDSR